MHTAIALLVLLNLFHWPGCSVIAQSTVIVTDSHCDGSNSVCVAAIRDVANGVVTFTVQSTASGYVALGIGSTQMGGASMYLGYNNGKGGVTISQRASQGHNTPQLTSSQEFTAVSTMPSSVQALSGAQITFAFNRTMSGSSLSKSISTSGTTAYSLVSSSRAPSNPSSSSASIVQHDITTGFTLNLASNSGTGVTTTSSPSAQPTTQNTNTGVSISSYCSGTEFCVTAMRDIPNNVVAFTIQSSSRGWVAIGVGSSSMSGATMYVAYKNSAGTGVTLSQRSSSGHNAPSLTSSQDFTLTSSSSSLPSYVTAVAGATNIVFTFNRTVASTSSANSISTSGSTAYIYGYSDSAPSNPNSALASIVQHDNYGSFSMDLSKAGVSTGTSSSDLTALLKPAHGICMFLAWGVFPFIGIFTARYLKDRLGHLWYQIHVGCMIGGVVIFTTLGLFAIEFSFPDGTQRFTTTPAHRLIGEILSFGILPAQVILGYVSNYLWTPTRTSIPWWDQAHWWFGRIAVVLAIAEMYLGIDLYGLEVGWAVAYWVWIVAVFGVLVFGQFQFGVVHHLNGNVGGQPSISRVECNQGMLAETHTDYISSTR